MSLLFLPFKAEDLVDLQVQSLHADIHTMALGVIEDLRHAENAYAWTGWHAYGRPVASCGIVDGWAWAFLAADLRKHMVPVSRKVREVLDTHLRDVGPVYAEIDPGHIQAVRWAALLGFAQDGESMWVFDARPVRSGHDILHGSDSCVDSH